MLTSDEGEGFVVVDANFNRIKIKGESYLRAHYLRSTVSASIKNVVEYVAKGETSEILAYFPDMKKTVEDINYRLDCLEFAIKTAYDQNKHLESQKDYALKVKDLPYSGILFGLRKGQITSIRGALAETDPKKLMELLKIDHDTYALSGIVAEN